MAQIMTYNSSLENYRRAGLVSLFTAAVAVEAGDFVYLDGGGQIRPAAHEMLLWGRGGISGVAESKAAAGEKVLVWQSGVFEFPTGQAAAIVPGNYLYVASVTTVDLGGSASEISCGVAETATAGAAAGELVEIFITPTRKQSPYLYSSSTPYL